MREELHRCYFGVISHIWPRLSRQILNSSFYSCPFHYLCLSSARVWERGPKLKGVSRRTRPLNPKRFHSRYCKYNETRGQSRFGQIRAPPLFSFPLGYFGVANSTRAERVRTGARLWGELSLMSSFCIMD